MTDLLPESPLNTSERLARLVVAVDAGCTRAELVADVEVAASVYALERAGR
jgi:formylmethanofuran dehydrogenase subunit B